MAFNISQINSPNFKGETRISKNGNPYYYANTGIITGGIITGLAAVIPPVVAASKQLKNPIKYAKYGLFCASTGCAGCF